MGGNPAAANATTAHPMVLEARRIFSPTMATVTLGRDVGGEACSKATQTEAPDAAQAVSIPERLNPTPGPLSKKKFLD